MHSETNDRRNSLGRTRKLTHAQIRAVERMAELLRETAEHHDLFEKTHADHHWWDWYAAYVNSRQNGSRSETAATAANRYMEEVMQVPLR